MKSAEKRLKRIVMEEGTRPRGQCPPEELLAAWAEEALSEPVWNSWLGHLARCADCRETLLALRTLLSETAEEDKFKVPAEALARAQTLDPAKKTVVEIVIRFAKGLAEVVKLSPDVVSGLVPAGETVRGRGLVVSESLINFTKEFPPFHAELEVEKTRPDRGEITVRITEQERGRPAGGIRVSLFANGEELESESLEQGVAVFQNVKFGKYRLEISRAGELVGRIALEMKGEER